MPGIAYGLSHDTRTVLLGASGFADLEAGTPVDAATTRFRCASITKTFTATLVLQQVERGRLRLDDAGDGAPRVDQGDPATTALTLRHLLMHAGSVNRDGSNDWSDRTMPDADALRAELRRSAAFGEPAERFRYSNLGYALLGEVLEAVTARRFAALLGRDVAKRLGLDATTGDLTPGARRELATGYYATWPSEAPRPAAHVEARAIAPAGGLVSTVVDLLEYQHAHLPGDPRLLSELSKREMQRPQWQRRGEPHYGLGWMTWTTGSLDLVGHSGGTPASRRWWASHRRTGSPARSSRTTCRGWRGSASGLVYDLVDAVSARWDVLATPSRFHTRRSLARFTGVYRDHFGERIVGRVNNGLCVLAPNGLASDASLLRATGPLRFLVADGDDFAFLGEQVRFRQDRRGTVTTLVWGAHELVRTDL